AGLVCGGVGPGFGWGCGCGVAPPPLRGGTSAPEPGLTGAADSVTAAVGDASDVAGAGATLEFPLLKSTDLLPELPLMANPMAAMLARPMTPATMSSGVRLPPFASRGGGCGMPAGVGDATLPPTGGYPWAGAPGAMPMPPPMPGAPNAAPTSSGVPISVLAFPPAGGGAARAPRPALFPQKASQNSVTVWKRSSGDLASARRSAPRIGSVARWPSASDSIGIGGWVMCCVAHSHAVSALKGSLPLSISYAMTPSE